MSFAPHDRIVAAIATAALLGSGSAQALLHRCGNEVVRASCCCEKGEQPAPESSRFQASDRACCSVTPAPARGDEAAPQPAVAHPHPVLVSVSSFAVLLAQAATVLPPLAVDRPRSAGPPILLATCSFLI